MDVVSKILKVLSSSTTLWELIQKENEQESIIIALEEQEDQDGFRFNEMMVVEEWIHMTGGLERVCNDVGLLRIRENKLICVGSIFSNDESMKWKELEFTMRKIGKLIVEDYENFC